MSINQLGLYSCHFFHRSEITKLNSRRTGIAIRVSAIPKTKYEVFLSFRGVDTRQGFTDVLYNHLTENGIQVFKDDDELEIGDKIELILGAITNSKMCVPIFSKSFASSAWCLREVAKMVELNKVIVPIFYDVTADDVKLKTPLYVNHLKEQEEKYGREQVEEWEKALVEVARIKGRKLNKDMGFVKFNKQFTTEILLKLGGKQKFTTYQFVEMTDQIKAAMDLLDIQSADVRTLGLYGMGGIGKTTLAKTIFNRISSNFDACSFLANIREECTTGKGLEYLLTKLQQDLNPKASSYDRMKSSLQMKSVLVVLDDVSERSHIRELIGEPISFGSGSRVIITTRDERVLTNLMLASSSNDEGCTKVSPRIAKMEIEGMNPEQAMQLFNGHAFGSDTHSHEYHNLSNDVISICAGLPLALEVIGSLLCGMTIQSWIGKIRKLKKIPAGRIQEKLMISYEALEDDEKEIFLDVACFFINEETSYPTYMWEACGFFPDWAVPVLISMSLVKIKDEKFWMHDQLRDLGKEIVSREGSRIRSYEDTLTALERQQAKEVVGLHLDTCPNTQIDLTAFENLRLLQAQKEMAFERFWQLPKNISWLSVHLVDPNVSVGIRSKESAVLGNQENSYLMKLAVLTLMYSCITDNWNGWILIQKLQGLKALNLHGCVKLTKTPDFSKMVALEHLILRECRKLVKIHSSIGKLLNLKHLDLLGCEHLRELPEEVGNLEDLEHINMNKTNISTLPDSIGKLKNLKFLSLSSCERLDKLPESIGDLVSLVQLEIGQARNLEELPASIGRLVKLEYLSLDGCEGISKLPNSIGDLTSLVSLSISRSYHIEELPSSVTRLVKLEKLSLSGCSMIVKLPDDFGNLKSLVELNLSGTCLTILSSETIKDAKNLKVLDLSRTRVRVLPETVAQLSHLETLNLSYCGHIQRLPELPTSLIDLKLMGCCSLRKAPDLSKFVRLMSLSLDDVMLSGTLCPNLKALSVRCSNSRSSIKYLPSNLQSLALVDVKRETKLPHLSHIKNLIELRFVDCLMEERFFLDLGVGRLGLLKRLIVDECDIIDRLPDIAQLKFLEYLIVLDCEKLVEIPGLGKLTSLRFIYIRSCNSLKSLENLKNLTKLDFVSLHDCKNFTRVEGFQGPPSHVVIS